MTHALLIDSLESVRVRIRRMSVLYGMGIVVAGVIGCLVGLVVLDYLLHLPWLPRLVLLAGAAGVSVWLATRYVYAPFRSRLSLSDVAGRAEQVFPQFQDRLRSSVEFGRAPVPGSQQMQQLVLGEASAMAQRTPLQSLAAPAPMWRALASGFGILLASLLALAVIPASVRGIILNRLFNPFTAVQWPHSVKIKFDTDVKPCVASGTKVDLHITLERGDQPGMRPIVHYQIDDGPVHDEFMNRDQQTSQFALSLTPRLDGDRPSQNMTFWIEAGDDSTPPRTIRIVPKLEIKDVHLTADSPAYVQPATTLDFDLTRQPAAFLEGSTLHVAATFSKPLNAGARPPRLLRAGRLPINATVEPGASPNQFVFQFDTTQLPPRALLTLGDLGTVSHVRPPDNYTFTFNIEATDIDDQTIVSNSEYTAVIRQDQPPAVFIETPRGSEDRTAESVVPLVGVIEDDGGLGQVSLAVTKLGANGAKATTTLVPLPDSAQNRGLHEGARLESSGQTGERIKFRVSYDWPLATSLNGVVLQPGDVLEYCLVATDNFRLGAHVHAPKSSTSLKITIISQDELKRQTIDQLREVKTQIKATKQDQDTTGSKTEDFGRDTQAKERIDDADAKVGADLQQDQSRVASTARSLADRLDELRHRLDENRSTASDLQQMAKDVSAQLRQTAESDMKDAAAKIGQASQANSSAKPQDRQDTIDAARDNQRKASAALDATLDKMADIGSMGRMIDNLQDLLDQQRKIGEETRDIGQRNTGKTPEQMSKQDRAKLEDLARQQNELAAKVNAAIDELSKQADQAEKTDPNSAEAMRNAAKQGQQRNVSQSQRQASEQMRQNQQSKARQQQQQAEVGLEMMLSELREAEKRKLGDLQRKLAEIEELIKTQIQRQAGHNLDNLTLRGPDAMNQAGADVVKALIEKAARASDEDPESKRRPDIGRLRAAQVTTQRNTDEISKKVAELPDGVEPSGRLARAATQMSRAVVHLGANKLVDAYEPPQVEALSALEDALRIVQKQKDKVDNDIDKQQRETIRQHYMKIRNEQNKLNTETARIDKTRNADQKLSRLEELNLKKLSDQQDGLAKEIEEIGKDLASLDSVVFVSSNKELGQQMADLKVELAKLDSGVTTQQRETRVLHRIDMLIESLKTRPKPKRFEQGGGGGGGQGQQKPRMPSEAELRLLQGMQTELNGETQDLDARLKLPGGVDASHQNEVNNTVADLGGQQKLVRDLLDELLKKTSENKVSLPPDPEKMAPLPEEANDAQLDNQELTDELINGEAGQDMLKLTLTRLGTRLSRARIRLADDHDPGKVTQVIQGRIVKDIEALIKQSEPDQSQSSSSSQQKPLPNPGTGQPKPAGQGQQPPQPQGSTAAQQSTDTRPGGQTGSGQDIRQTAEEWGKISPRLRGPVLESRDDAVIERYRRLIEDYTQAISTEVRGEENK